MQNLSTGTMSHRILLVDDEIDILEFVRYNLLKEGYEVFTAQNGAEALKAAAECRPHLILLDMMMPVMDGAQTWSRHPRRPAAARHDGGIPLGAGRGGAAAYGLRASERTTTSPSRSR